MSTDGTCTRPAGWGTDHVGIGRCKLHGGSTPSHVKAATIEKATREVARLGLSREIHPHQALVEAVWEAQGEVDAWRLKVEALTPAEWIGSDGRANPYVEQWQLARKALKDISKATADAGVSERQVRVLEGQAQQLIAVLQTVLSDPELGLSRDQSKLAGPVVRRALSAHGLLPEVAS